MSRSPRRFAVVASTSGSVLDEVLKNDFFRSRVHSVIVDRACGAGDKALSHRVRVEDFREPDVESFCDRLLAYVNEHGIEYIFSFYTRFYSKGFRDACRDRIINFHPSLLPAFKGMNGFRDTIDYHTRLAGNTVEFIDEVMDEGKIVMQTVCPVDLTAPIAHTRHRIFVQQCKSLIQVAHWLEQDRITVSGRRVLIRDATFEDIEFSPALEFVDAIDLQLAMPEPVTARFIA